MKKLILILTLSSMLYACKKEPTQNITNEYYTVVECDSTHSDSTMVDSLQTFLPDEFVEWHNIFEGEGVGAAVNLYEDILILFNLEGDRFAWFEDQEIKAVYDLSSNNHVLENCPFDAVRAAVMLNGDDLYFFNEDGDMFVSASNFQPTDTPGSWDDDDFLTFSEYTFNTWEWGSDYSFPFNTAEVAWNYSNDGGSCFDATEDTQYTWISSGNEVAKYDTWGYFEDEFDIENWTAENNCGGPDGILPFDEIGAACRYVKPNLIQEIFFSEDGTQFCYYNVSEGIFSEIYDLY